jgi:hypothetical protein
MISIIYESFYDGFKINNQFVSVYKNPSYSEILELKKEMKEANLVDLYLNKFRGIITEEGDLYIWPSNILHSDILFKIDKDWHDQYISRKIKNIIPVFIDNFYVALNFDVKDKLLIKKIFSKTKEKNPQFEYEF